MPKQVPITFDTLESALDWSSLGDPFENQAFIARETGELFFQSSFGDTEEELPDDIDDGSLYIAMPHKNDLDLGRNLVFAFAEQFPQHASTIESFFRARGAYAKLKDYLERNRLLDRWYAYQAAETKKALEKWASKNGFVMVEDVGDG